MKLGGETSMAEKSKEKVFAERQHDYKQKKETIFKKALKEQKNLSAEETKENDKNS